MHDSSTIHVVVRSNLVEPRGNIYVRRRRSIDYVHRPEIFSSTVRRPEHRARTAQSLPRIPLRALFTRRVPESGHRPREWLHRTLDIAAEKHPYSSERRSLAVNIHDPPQDGAPGGFFIPRGTNFPVGETSNEPRDDRSGRETSGTFGTRRYTANTLRMHRRAGDEKKRDRRRERERGRNVEADARRLGTRVRRPTEARFGCQSTPHPKLDSSSSNESAVSVGSPSGTGVARGRRGWVRGECDALAPGESADGGIRCTRYLPLGTLSFYGAHRRGATRARGLISRRHR